MRLQDKVVIITGAASGIGKGMATLFVAEGAKVVAADWNQETLDAAVAELSATGAQIVGVQGNIADRAQAEAIVDKAVEAFGCVDVLVNNAGVMDQNEAIGDVGDDVWDRVLGVNLGGPKNLSRKAINLMVEQGGGSIVNVASIAGITGSVAGVSYTVSKHGVVGLTRSTAWLYAQKGVRCNAILPGAVETNIQASMDMTKIDAWASERLQPSYGMIPGQLAPADIANLALFLASDESKMINGAIITADGGWRA